MSNKSWTIYSAYNIKFIRLYNLAFRQKVSAYYKKRKHMKARVLRARQIRK